MKNEGYDVSEKFEKDLVWLKKLRNSIEHHKFSMNLEEVEEAIGRLMSAVHEFDESHESIDLSSQISSEQYDLFHLLANTYEGRIKKAENLVKEAEKEAYKGVRYKEYDQVNFHIYHCYECDHKTMIPNQESSTGYKCTFCGNEDSEDIEVDCDICGAPWAISEMMTLEEGEYMCPYCRHDPEYVDD